MMLLFSSYHTQGVNTGAIRVCLRGGTTRNAVCRCLVKLPLKVQSM